LYTPEKKFLGMGYIGYKIPLNGQYTRITKILPATGLQIKSDPGVAIVYLGFLILIPSIIISYTSYSQIWGIGKSQSLYIHANTNRAVYFFEKSILEIAAVLNTVHKNIKR
jgi:cytochrome c biogenesis protein